MKIEKKEAIKLLWSAVEDTIKSLKTINENSVISASHIEHLWLSLQNYQDNLRYIKEVNIGCFYKRKSYDNEYVIFRAENFSTDEDGLTVFVRTLTATKKRVDYTNIVDETHYAILNMKDLEEIQIKPEDLPLYIDNEFKGTLFTEILTKE